MNIDQVIANDSRHEERRRPKRKKRRAETYAQKGKRVHYAWEKSRDRILNVYVSTEVLLEETCSMCDSPATHRCIECGNLFYCHSHVHAAHQECFHAPEVWQVRVC